MPLPHIKRLCKVKKCKRTGKPCRNPAVEGKAVCKTHGGGTKKRVREGTRKPPGRPPTTGQWVDPNKTQYAQLDDLRVEAEKDKTLLKLALRVARMEAIARASREVLKKRTGPVTAKTAAWLLDQEERIALIVDRTLKSNFRDKYEALLMVMQPFVEKLDELIDEYVAEDRRGAFRDAIRRAARSLFVAIGLTEQGGSDLA